MTAFTFHCPKCSSTRFGSSNCTSVTGPLTRHCHGGSGTNNPCRFTWPEPDDWKYMTVDGKKLDQEAFLAVMKKIREMPVYGTPMGELDEL